MNSTSSYTQHTLKATFLGFVGSLNDSYCRNDTLDIVFIQNNDNLKDVKLISFKTNDNKPLSHLLASPLEFVLACNGLVSASYIKPEKREELKGALCCPRDCSDNYYFKNLPLIDSLKVNFMLNYHKFFQYEIILDGQLIINNDGIHYPLDNENSVMTPNFDTYLNFINIKYDSYRFDECFYNQEIHENNYIYETLKTRQKHLEANNTFKKSFRRMRSDFGGSNVAIEFSQKYNFYRIRFGDKENLKPYNYIHKKVSKLFKKTRKNIKDISSANLSEKLKKQFLMLLRKEVMYKVDQLIQIRINRHKYPTNEIILSSDYFSFVKNLFITEFKIVLENVK